MLEGNLLYYFLALIIAFGVTVAVAPKTIQFLKKLKFGQSILEIGPNWHKSKQGTPTMGGIMFILAVIVVSLIFCRDMKVVISILMALCYGVVGFIDDYIKVVRKHNQGLNVKQKFVLQFIVSAVYLWSMTVTGNMSSVVYIPFVSHGFDIGFLYYVLSFVFIVGVVNSVNLTDGIDGLAAGVSTPVFLFFAVAAIMCSFRDAAIYACALAGGCLGFLVFNFHPAKVFMGDTGSLFLGGAVCSLAYALDMPLIIVIAGLIYLIEALSVMLQVAYFKKTKKRLFKMSPIHHHFEMSGWKETKIVFVFTGITVILCIIAYFGISAWYVA
ncbi:MAG: phospho-N-acetylmuramoyl-pentapeptide-transferase [Clostridia bacterium]|nr:phospho-N-acetylmuramoyl-pentapeptide-transferase [Clostridia bacterium]